jgi:hypothetical protein
MLAVTDTLSPGTSEAGRTLKALFAEQNEGGVLELVPGLPDQIMSLTVTKTLTLRGPDNSSQKNWPTIVAEQDCVSAIAVSTVRDSEVSFTNLHLRHGGGSFDIESSTDESKEFGSACCVGVDGGSLQMNECSVSAVNGTCIGLVGEHSTAIIRSCELANSSVGTAACQAARLRCVDCTFSHLSHAGAVLIGNKTLGELEANTMDRCGVLGISVSEGAGLIAEGNSVAQCSRAGISVVSTSWARATSNRIVDNGEHGVSRW